MNPPFDQSEYHRRLETVRSAMTDGDIEILLVSDPSNMNWLTGFEAWSFYVPQLMVVSHDQAPVWLGRAMDAGAVPLTTYLPESSIRPYREDLVQQPDSHPMSAMASWMLEQGYGGARIGYDSDGYYFSPRSLSTLESGLPQATFVDDARLVNWARCIKSDAEIEIMARSARLVEGAMQTAIENVRPGMRQSELMADIVAAQIRGTGEFGGDITALSPLILAGEAASTAHPMWTDAEFETNQIVAFELGGTHRRYNAGLARTVQLGPLTDKLVSTAAAVEEGLEAVLEVVKAGLVAEQAHAAWQCVLNRHGLSKDSRIGYSIGVGYPPDWGEHTVSLRPGDGTVLQPNMCIHVMLGMWLDGWGMELSETVRVTERGCDCLTRFPRTAVSIQ